MIMIAAPPEVRVPLCQVLHRHSVGAGPCPRKFRNQRWYRCAGKNNPGVLNPRADLSVRPHCLSDFWSVTLIYARPGVAGTAFLSISQGRKSPAKMGLGIYLG